MPLVVSKLLLCSCALAIGFSSSRWSITALRVLLQQQSLQVQLLEVMFTFHTKNHISIATDKSMLYSPVWRKRTLLVNELRYDLHQRLLHDRISDIRSSDWSRTVTSNTSISHWYQSHHPLQPVFSTFLSCSDVDGPAARFQISTDVLQIFVSVILVS